MFNNFTFISNLFVDTYPITIFRVYNNDNGMDSSLGSQYSDKISSFLLLFKHIKSIN